MIELEDGTSVPVSELLAYKKRWEETEVEKQLLQEDMQKVGTLFRSDSTVDDRENAIRAVLSNSGYEDEAIDNYILQARQSMAEQERSDAEGEFNSYLEDDDIEEIDLPDIEEEDDETSGGTPEETMSENINDESSRILQQELEAQRAELHKMRVRELRERLNSELDRTLENNPEFQKLLNASRSLRGDEGVTQAKQTLRAQLEQQALERMQARRAASGTFEDAWMSEEVEKAAEPVLGTFRSVIGDIDKLGRSSETVTGFDAEEILRSKPVPDPEWKPGATISDLESQVKSFTTDTIARGMASSPGESAI